MKKFGLIGGIGPESTIEYYRLIIKEYRERLGTKEYPEIIINSINMTEMLGYVFDGKLEELVRFLVEHTNALERTGVDYAALASNTPHIVFDELRERVEVSLISIVEETCKVVGSKNMTRVGLLGTRSTMSQKFYNKVAAQYGIEIFTPSSDQQDFVHHKYMSELVFNQINVETRNQLIEIVKGMKERDSISGLILGGTELPLILGQSNFDDIEVFDTTRIHVASIVTRMIDE